MDAGKDVKYALIPCVAGGRLLAGQDGMAKRGS